MKSAIQKGALLTVVLYILLASLHTVPALGVQDLPGSTWGQLSYNGDHLVGTAAQGNISQGIDWVRFLGDVTLNTFVEFRYRFRSKNKEYYNAYSEAAGIQLKWSPFRLGANYLFEKFPDLDERSNKFQYFLGWYHDWDIRKNGGLPGSTWGELTYDADDIIGAGTMGYINQGIDWITLPMNIVFNTFIEFRYRFRGRNKTFYNVYGEAVGIEFRKSPFRLGANYLIEKFPDLNERSNKFQYYLSWYFDWNLKQ